MESAPPASSFDLPAPRLAEVASLARALRGEVPLANRGLGYVRYLIARGLQGDYKSALVHAEARDDWRSTPNVVTALKAAVAAGTTTHTTWAAPIALQGLAADFLEIVRPLTVIDRLPTRVVPFNVKVARQTAAVVVDWVGESQPKPIGALAFSDLTMSPKKVAGIVVITNELLRFAAVDAERLIRNDLAASIAAFCDRQFLDPSVTASAARPASITSSVTPITSVNLATDTKAAINALIAGGSKLRAPYWTMRPEVAARAAAVQTVPTLPGSLAGFPVLSSPDAPAASLVLLDAAEIVVGDGELTVDASQEGTLEMSDNPASDTGTEISLWQGNLHALRAERTISWLPARAAAASAAIVTNVAY